MMMKGDRTLTLQSPDAAVAAHGCQQTPCQRHRKGNGHMIVRKYLLSITFSSPFRSAHYPLQV